MGYAARAVRRALMRSEGRVGKDPRILNVTTGNAWLGYTEDNRDATTAFSKMKVHKGMFEGAADIEYGHLIVDRSDGDYYFVMSAKGKYSRGEVAYLDAALYRTASTCVVQRFVSGTKDDFGYDIDPSPTVIKSDVHLMINPLSFSEDESEDRMLRDDKIRVVIQSSVPVEVNDRLVTDDEVYRVILIDRKSLKNLLQLQVEKDTR